MEPVDAAALRAHFEHAAQLSPEACAEYVRRLEEQDPEMAAQLREVLETPTRGFLSTPPWQRPPADGALHATRTFRIGDVLNQRFEIEAFLGEGGAGQVYRAFDRNRQAPIALKTLRPELSGNASAVDALRNELNTATLVSSPNVCRLYDIQIQPTGAGASFITMELLSGDLLSARIPKTGLPITEARPIVDQIAKGLVDAHSCGIVHRDLKPGNIFLVPAEPGFRAVITDFGLARTITPGADLTLTLDREVAGTAAYMAPEQIEGTRLTQAVDIHALGAIMFEMVTGRVPFEGRTALAIVAARLNTDAPSPRRYRPDVDAQWERTILACLARDAARRPASVGEVLALLDRPTEPKWPRRAAIAALAAALGAGTFVIERPVEHNPAAEAAYKQGAEFNQWSSPKGIAGAIREFQKATDLEPKWAAPWSHLADAYGAASNAGVMDPIKALAQARSAAQHAIALDPRLGRAHGSLAWTLSLDLDEWPKAEAEFRSAIALDDRDADVHRWFAVHLRKLGRFHEAEHEINTAGALTPSSDPRVLSELAFLRFTERQPALFHNEVDYARLHVPNNPLIESLYAKSLELDGKFAEALDHLDFVKRLGLNPALVLALKAGVEVSRNDTSEARRLALEVEKLWKTEPVDGILLAGVYARLGDSDEAFRIIGEARRRKDNTLLSLATSPWMDPLRPDPRFREWLGRLHFTDQIMQRMEFKLSSDTGSSTQPSRTGTS